MNGGGRGRVGAAAGRSGGVRSGAGASVIVRRPPAIGARPRSPLPLPVAGRRRAAARPARARCSRGCGGLAYARRRGRRSARRRRRCTRTTQSDSAARAASRSSRRAVAALSRHRRTRRARARGRARTPRRAARGPTARRPARRRGRRSRRARRSRALWQHQPCSALGADAARRVRGRRAPGRGRTRARRAGRVMPARRWKYSGGAIRL